MVDKFTKQYAWTELKKIDWAAKAKQFRPLFEKAQADNDKHAYALALRDFLWSIPDTHVGFDETLLQQRFPGPKRRAAWALPCVKPMMARSSPTYILAGGPAEKAGMKWGAEIISLDGKPTADVVAATVPWSSPFSNDTIKRLQQLRYALRFSLDKGKVEVDFKNPGGSQKTASLPVVSERDSFNVSSF